MFLAVRSRDVAFAGLERQRGRHLISRSDTPKLWREFWAGQAEMAPRFRPDLEFGIDALERKLFVGMLRAQLGTAELEAGPNARLGEAGLQRDVGRVRELTADV